MKDFTEFMNNPTNRIASQTQFTSGIEGYVYDGIDGSQMAFWTNPNGGKSVEHTHECDEYIVVVQGKYSIIIERKRIPIKVGEEYLIMKGILHGGESEPGTSTNHAFGGKRAERESEIKTVLGHSRYTGHRAPKFPPRLRKTRLWKMPLLFVP